MSNELTYPDGMPISLRMTKADISGTATTNLTFTNGGAGFKVPTGYTFHPLALHAELNTAVLGGTLTFKVTANTTASVNGPSVVLNTTVQKAISVQRVGVEPIAAGKIVGINVVSASFTPTTGDVDAILLGVLTPV